MSRKGDGQERDRARDPRRHPPRDDQQRERDGGTAAVPPAATEEDEGRPAPTGPLPWAQRRAGGDTVEDRAAALFRYAPAPPPLGEQAQARVRDRLLPARRTRRGRPRVAAWQWSIAAGLLFGSGAVIAARNVERWWHAAPAPETTVAPPPASPPAHRPARAPASAGARASTLGIETRVLNRAITLLRRSGDAAGALGELDSYLRRFPAGTLAAEARTARVDALLMLGRREEALLALDRLPLQGSEGGRQHELRVIRGELRATGDCSRAIADFDEVLATEAAAPLPVTLAERALFGRAVCLVRAGLPDQAKSEASRYLERFPQGRFATDARRLVSRPAAFSRRAKSAPASRPAAFSRRAKSAPAGSGVGEDL